MKNTLKIIADSIRVSTEKISWNNLKDKPFYEKASYTDTLTWDGTTEGYYNFYDEITESTFVHISDATPTLDDLVSFSITDNSGDIYLPEDDWQFAQNENIIVFQGPTPIFIILVDNFELEGIIFTKKGIYVANFNGIYMTSFTVKDYQFFTGIIKKLDEKYIPDTIAKKSDIPVVPEQKQADWDEFDTNSKEYIKNRTHYLDYINGEIKPLSDDNPLSAFYNIWSEYKALLVIYDGEEYLLKIKYASEPNASVYYVGNFDNLHSKLNSVAPLETNEGSDDVPFLITCHYHSMIGMAYNNIFYLDESTEHTLELYYIIPKAIPLDEKFIPDTVVKCHTAEVGQIIVVKSVNENGIPIEWEATDGQNSQTCLTLHDINTGYKHYIFIEDGYVNSTMAISGIKVLSNPTKLDYSDTDLFDPTGMVVVSVLPNGKEMVITNDITYDKFVTLGSTSHIITYTEINGTSYTAEIPITTRTLESALKDFIYITNDDGTFTINGWKETFKGEPSTRCIVPNSELVII